MSLIELSVARAHLRLEDDYPNDQLQGKLGASESAAAQFLNRRLFKDVAALQAAVDAVPADLADAGSAHRDAIEAADAIEDPVARCAARSYAGAAYAAAQSAARETYAGIVLNEQIEAGVLLILGRLFEDRQGDGVEIPRILWPFRVGLGV